MVKALPIPGQLAAVLLNPDLMQDFPEYAKVFARLVNKRALPAFGLVFGWQGRPPASAPVIGRQSQRTGSPAVVATAGTFGQLSATPCQAVNRNPPVTQHLGVTPCKRPSPTATVLHQATSDEPLTKRPRSVDSPRVIIPVISRETQAVSTI
ncbi:hypothetical protein QFC22_000622 [Naganishia vaughanmartiniae]|uniref:Uncharacterized protein n=1 Tax=Naganishia vaughanmartiniae TaxID=1424756 RepID=A0ACC2XPT6_9TREE|nr:hypothetical protein QFC22_000622 [Naganishia vaughanmartiniae]